MLFSDCALECARSTLLFITVSNPPARTILSYSSVFLKGGQLYYHDCSGRIQGHTIIIQKKLMVRAGA